MQDFFVNYIDKLPELLKRLLKMVPTHAINLPKNIPLKGIYLFSENDNHLYVGRSNNIKRRIQNHCRPSASHHQATFAFRIARVDTNLEKATYKTEGSRKQLEEDPKFKLVFTTAKERVRNMDLRFIEANDPILQALFEIYVAVTLDTPYNNFDNH